MHHLFPGYYKPSNDDRTTIWQTCTFAFDTNVLLNVAGYSQEAQDGFFAVLEKLAPRIWLPYQVAEEYHRIRLQAVRGQIKVCEDITSDLKKNIDRVHRSLGSRSSTQQLRAALAMALTEVEQVQPTRTGLLSDDEVTLRIVQVFGEAIGKPYDPDQQEQAYAAAEQRFARKQPPGYKDGNKEGERAYGDVLLWLQLLDHARSTKKSIILVTDEKKEDWWLQDRQGIVAPRPELVQEMMNVAGVRFLLYQTDRFLEYAQQFSVPVEPEVIEEIREVREEVEQQHEAESKVTSITKELNDLARVRAAQTYAAGSVSPTLREIFAQMQASSLEPPVGSLQSMAQALARQQAMIEPNPASLQSMAQALARQQAMIEPNPASLQSMAQAFSRQQAREHQTLYDSIKPFTASGTIEHLVAQQIIADEHYTTLYKYLQQQTNASQAHQQGIATQALASLVQRTQPQEQLAERERRVQKLRRGTTPRRSTLPAKAEAQSELGQDTSKADASSDSPEQNK